MNTQGRRSPTNLLRWLWLAGWAVLVLGLLLHLTIRDRFNYVAAVFYALPLPLLGMVALVLGCWPEVRRIHRIILAAAGLLILGPSYHSCLSPRLAADPKTFSALIWNLNRPAAPRPELIQMVEELQPDVVGCIEPGTRFMEQGQDYERALPGYTCHLMPRGMIFLSRWPAHMRGRGKLDGIGAFSNFDVTTPHGTVRVVLVDVNADPLMPRRRSLEEALSYVEENPHCIIMGDFNTPSGSVFYKPYVDQGLRNALPSVACGWHETWPYGLPLLSLDHIWCGKGWRIVGAKKIHHWCSDHAAVFARLMLK